LGVRASPIRFGVFEIDLASGELRKQGVRIKLQEQPFQALLALIERPREVLTREELRKRIWPPDTTVDFDSGLNKVINRLREALGDDADNPRFIETLPQRGYRFLQQVEAVAADAPPPVSAAEAPLARTLPTQGGRRWLFVAIGLAPLIFISYLLLRSHQSPIRSIAVLPLANLSGDPAQEYFSDGLTDELIGEVARIRSLRVISRTSVMQYKTGARKLLPAIARELDVDAILEGTVVQSGQRIRITAQLIRARDDRHLWSEEYERDFTDILSLQGEVARAIASKIQIELTPGEHTSVIQRRRVNPEAYEAYLKGNFFLHKGIPRLAESIGFFTQAVKIDPSQAEAYAGLAEALCYAGIFELRPSAETYPEARTAALRALELDESNAAAHNALADVKQGYDWDLAAAEAEFQRALQLNPSHLLTRLWHAECLTRMGRFDDAITESGRAIALDPVSANTLGNRAMLLWRARRYDESIRAGGQSLNFDSNFVNALWWQGLSYAGKGEFSESIACLTKASNMSDGPLFRALLGHVYGRAGDKSKALAVLAELAAMSKRRFVSPVDFAIVCAGLGDADSTFSWLEKAYQARAIGVVALRSPYFDSFRSDARYADLCRRVGLPTLGRIP
jgi:TolB-like protein/DNA-binding winged helix-turn-helix (wHTH) protein